VKDIWLEKEKTGRQREKTKTINGDLSLQIFSPFFISALGLFWNNFSAEVQWLLTNESYVFDSIFFTIWSQKGAQLLAWTKGTCNPTSLETFMVTPSNLYMMELCSNWHCSSKAWWQEVQTWPFLFKSKPSVSTADSTEVPNYLQVCLLRVKM